MQIREITSADLPEVIAILCEGFPRRSKAYWQNGFSILQRRPVVPGYPQFGLALVEDNTIQGVILLLTADVGDGPRSNLSSWYVRPAYRTFATILFQRALKKKDGVYLNLSPSAQALPIAAAFGFKPYTAGSVVLDARSAWRTSNGRIKALRSDSLETLPAALRTSLESHSGYGCAGFEFHDAKGSGIALYRIKKLRGVIPCAQFVFGDPARLLALAGPLMRGLLCRGIPAALLDSDGTETAIAGQRMPGHSIRYARGSPTPSTGDLIETEIAIFGP